MNRIAVSLTLIIIILSMMAFSTIFLNISFNQYCEQIEVAIDHAENDRLDQAQTQFLEFYKHFTRQEKLYHFIAGHDTINLIKFEALTAKFLIEDEDGNVADFISKCYSIINSLGSLKTNFNRFI